MAKSPGDCKATGWGITSDLIELSILHTSLALGCTTCEMQTMSDIHNALFFCTPQDFNIVSVRVIPSTHSTCLVSLLLAPTQQEHH